MKFLLKLLIVLAILGGLGFVVARPVIKQWKESRAPKWRTAKVTKGRIVADVKATGTVKPVMEVMIGSFVSGPISEIFVDFNQEVKKGEVMALVDPRLLTANMNQNKAVLATREAEVERAKALLEQARRNEKRAITLHEENPDFISGKDMDSFHYEVKSLEAQLKLAEASVLQAKAALDNSQYNLEYTKIEAPVDGIVIDRKIDPGQTLAAQFQTPELFIVAPDMDKKMHVFASVDEADIGLVIQAKKDELPVEFTVDAYPDEVFHGKIEQVRRNSTTTENVVTYPVVVAAPNPNMKLLPGMTASLSFQVDERKDVIRIPNAALRFYPVNELHVHPDDRKILTGEDDDETDALPQSHLTEEERAKLEKRLRRRHVWKQDGEFLRAMEVEVGLNDLKFTELLSGELSEGDELVIDQE